MVWAVDLPGGRRVLSAAGFDLSKPAEWAPQQDAVQSVLQAAEEAIAPPEVRPFRRQLERIRPGLYGRFIQWLWGQDPPTALADVAGGAEQLTCRVLRMFFESCQLDPGPLPVLAAERELRNMERVRLRAEPLPQRPVDLLVPLAPCSAHQAPADWYCPAQGQLVCALCLAPGGAHAGHEARLLRRATRAGGLAPHPHEQPGREPEGPPLLGYPCRPLKVGERFEWLPSQLGPRGRYFALAGGALPTGVQLDGVTGLLWGCPEEAGQCQCTVTCGAAAGEVSFAITSFEPSIRTIAGNGVQGRAMSVDPLQCNVSDPFGVVADADNVYVAQNDGARSVLRIPRRGGAPEVVAGGCDAETRRGLLLALREGIPAAEALMLPRGLALDGENLYVCSSGKVRRVELRPGGLIHTVAGGGSQGHFGDGGPARSAELDRACDVAVHEHILFVACCGAHVVRAVDLRSGLIFTAAGSGSRGFSGDGGPAIAAQLSWPRGVCVSGGVLYIADNGNQRVRRVDLTAGLISTAAGGGEGAPDGHIAPTAAELNEPKGLTAGDGGGVYITDEHRVLLLRGGALTPVCGTVNGGAADRCSAAEGQLNHPYGIAFAGGALYVGDYSNHRVREISPLEPPQPPAGGPQGQQWSWARGGQGAGMESPALRLHSGSAICRLALKQPPVGACMALSFAGAPLHPARRYATGASSCGRAVRGHTWAESDDGWLRGRSYCSERWGPTGGGPSCCATGTSPARRRCAAAASTTSARRTVSRCR
eukprot:TRINITY_DN9496_c0_g1_i7.p1 TRINITY_DN9496_c0_g1~~TRINITY_DN9496_c0_g1_i7.p1  ORF type:complete len:828 (+),score=193.40 TRINITY_DN9496_c0_g1_i7:195-2486(+)